MDYKITESKDGYTYLEAVDENGWVVFVPADERNPDYAAYLAEQ